MRLLLVLAILATAYGMYFPPGNGDIWVAANRPIHRNKIGGSNPPHWPNYRTVYKSTSAQDPNFSCPDGNILEGEPVPPHKVCRHSWDNSDTTYSCERNGDPEVKLTYSCTSAKDCPISAGGYAACHDLTAMMRGELASFNDTVVLGFFACCHQEAKFDD